MTTTLQPLVSENDSVWRITIIAEAPNDAIRNAAEEAIEEAKMDYAASSLKYREEILARSYMLGTVRATHHVIFTGEPEAAEVFFRSLKRRIDLVVRHSPHYRIIEETPVKMTDSTAFRTSATQAKSLPTVGFNKPSEDVDLTKSKQILSKREADTEKGGLGTSEEARDFRGKHLGRWLLLGLSLLVLLFLILQKTISKKTSVSADTKEAVARMYLTRHGKGYLREVSRQEMPNGMEFQFENGKNRFSVVVDDGARVTSWRKVR